MISDYQEYILPNGIILRISKDVLNAFYEYRQASFQRYESGGILLGKVFDKYILIEKVTTPGKKDKRGRFFFHRHKGRAQSIVNKVFKETDGQQIYIGEWHTHREKNPSPSFIDKFEIKRAFKKSTLNLEFIICIIVGNDNTVGNIWVGYYNGKIMKVCDKNRSL